jgi:hypothetical protein
MMYTVCLLSFCVIPYYYIFILLLQTNEEEELDYSI